MYAQLGAIAREFNFPSIAGICLYMHVDEAGALFAPRISEESWGILWGHLFESNAPGPTGRLPISGRIEFDIGRFRNGLGPPLSVDTRFVHRCEARWYRSWISVSRRESAHVASMRQCQESKTTEDGQEQNQTTAVPKTRTSYTLKRLSLLEWFDLTNSPPPMQPSSESTSIHSAYYYLYSTNAFLSIAPPFMDPPTNLFTCGEAAPPQETNQ